MLRKSDIKEIEIELTGVCNLNCWVCSRNFVHSQYMVKKNIRPLADLTRQLDEFTGLQTVFLAGTLSEPTLYPEFFGLLEYLNERNVVYHIFTNGNTHNEDWWRQLGQITTENSRVIFTICGSTQELHEKYRVGSDLKQLLRHAECLREVGKGNDYGQHILFDYNKEDFDNGGVKSILSQFSHSFQVTAEYRRRLNEKIKEPPPGIQPPKRVKCVVDHVFEHRLPLNSKICINCRSLQSKKVYMNQFGRIFPCFTFAEFENEEFDFDYSKILDYNYPDCWLCSKNVDNILKPLGIDIVC